MRSLVRDVGRALASVSVNLSTRAALALGAAPIVRLLQFRVGAYLDQRGKKAPPLYLVIDVA
ncbi:MAG: hypothetical protein PHO46_05215 [Thermoguttaceae bacterium]|nr:hypothetical protein [Thermoguttaceae bacterium]